MEVVETSKFVASHVAFAEVNCFGVRFDDATLERTFLIDMELFGSPLNCSMTSCISYCLAFPEDEIFGAITDSFI